MVTSTSHDRGVRDRHATASSTALPAAHLTTIWTDELPVGVSVAVGRRQAAQSCSHGFIWLDTQGFCPLE